MKNSKNIFNWTMFSLLTAIALYWLSNVILWYRSFSTTLSMIIMLTLNPIIWGYGIYYCLVRYPERDKIKPAVICAFTMLIISVIADYIFFVWTNKRRNVRIVPSYHIIWLWIYIFPAIYPRIYI